MGDSTSGQSAEPAAVRSDWVVLKSLLDTQYQLLQIMEQHALRTCHEDIELTDAELVAQLEEARANHEQAIDDIETAIDALSE